MSLRRDLTYTVRSLRRSPGFLAAVLITLAVSIGASTTMLAIVDSSSGHLSLSRRPRSW